MPCPYAGGADSRETVDREDFLRSTLVIGGRDALQATLMRYGPPDLEPSGVPPRSGGQYDWAADDGGTDDASCPVDHETGDSRYSHDDGAGDGHAHGDADGEAGGCPVDHDVPGSAREDDGADDEYDDFVSEWPAYHVVYRLSHEGADPAADRRRLTDALAATTEIVGWGRDGMTWAVGFAPEHLADAGDAVPAPLRAAPAGGSVAPDGGRAVGGDCLLHLASDEPRRLLVAEALLWDGTEGLDLDASLPQTVGDAYPRPQSAPERLVTISPHGVDAPTVEGDAVLQLSRFEESPDDAPEGDDGEAAECPVDHEGEGRSDHDHGGRGHGDADGDTDDEGGENGLPNAVDLRHLNPASPGVLRIGLHAPAESDPGTERYYLPAAANRAVTSGD